MIVDYSLPVFRRGFQKCRFPKIRERLAGVAHENPHARLRLTREFHLVTVLRPASPSAIAFIQLCHLPR
jgi:hypothetical protein